MSFYAMKPGDIVKVTYPIGSFFIWEVLGVYLGAEDQESVIELKSCSERKNTQARVLIPQHFFNALQMGGRVEVLNLVEYHNV